MSEKKERNAATGGGLDRETLERLAAEYRDGLEELCESRRRRADAFAAMTEEEVNAALAAELEEILADAEKHKGKRASAADAGSAEGAG